MSNIIPKHLINIKNLFEQYENLSIQDVIDETEYAPETVRRSINILLSKKIIRERNLDRNGENVTIYSFVPGSFLTKYEFVLFTVNQKSPVTIKDILKIAPSSNPSSIYNALDRLKKSGQIVKEGRLYYSKKHYEEKAGLKTVKPPVEPKEPQKDEPPGICKSLKDIISFMLDMAKSYEDWIGLQKQVNVAVEILFNKKS